MVYTRTGDSGDTLLLSICLPKHHPCIHFLGAVDEALAFTGLAIELTSDRSIRAKLAEVYGLLSKVAGALYTGWCPSDQLIRDVEKRIDEAPKPATFIPNFSVRGGVAPVAVVRTIVRRAERWYWFCQREANIGCKNLGVLLNRLSDYVFIIQYEALLKLEGNRRSSHKTS